MNQKIQTLQIYSDSELKDRFDVDIVFTEDVLETMHYYLKQKLRLKRELNNIEAQMLNAEKYVAKYMNETGKRKMGKIEIKNIFKAIFLFPIEEEQDEQKTEETKVD